MDEHMRKRKSPERILVSLSLGLFIIGVTGYFSVSRELWLFLMFAHLGALGLLGLLASLIGKLARRKQRRFLPAFLTGITLPVVLGLAAVAAFYFKDGGQLYCGGAVSLPVSLILLSGTACLRKRG